MENERLADRRGPSIHNGAGIRKSFNILDTGGLQIPVLDA